MDSDQIQRLIESGVPDCTASVEGDGMHFQAIVVSHGFEGLTPLKRHRIVYAALGSRVGSEIHALSIQAYTPGEWEKSKPSQVL